MITIMPRSTSGTRFVLKAALVACSLSGLALALQPEGKPAAMPAMDKKQIAAMMGMKGQPGPEQKFLETLVGTFDTEYNLTTMPGTPPLVAKGSQKGEMVLGGRFLQVHSTPAADEELKIESLSYLGFDNRNKKYFWWGIDSTDTYSVFAEGDMDPATKTITLLGENEEPGMGKMPFKTIFKLADPDRTTMEIWFQFKGAPGAEADGWFRIMEMIKTRKK